MGFPQRVDTLLNLAVRPSACVVRLSLQSSAFVHFPLWCTCFCLCSLPSLVYLLLPLFTSLFGVSASAFGHFPLMYLLLRLFTSLFDVSASRQNPLSFSFLIPFLLFLPSFLPSILFPIHSSLLTCSSSCYFSPRVLRALRFTFTACPGGTGRGWGRGERDSCGGGGGGRNRQYSERAGLSPSSQSVTRVKGRLEESSRRVRDGR